MLLCGLLGMELLRSVHGLSQSGSCVSRLGAQRRTRPRQMCCSVYLDTNDKRDWHFGPLHVPRKFCFVHDQKLPRNFVGHQAVLRHRLALESPRTLASTICLSTVCLDLYHHLLPFLTVLHMMQYSSQHWYVFKPDPKSANM